MSEELSERVVGSSGEIGLWRAVLDQALQDACTKPRVMPCGDRTFSSQETEKARDWFWQADPDFVLVCDFADLEPSALCKYAQDVISHGRRRRHQRRIVS